MIPQSVKARFLQGVQQQGPDDCWEFAGGSHNKRGWHRLISFRDATGKKNFPAHRVAYELRHGEIPNGLFVLHRCDNPRCCNPSHLFLGTQSDNAKDMWGKARGRPGGNKGMKLGPSPFRKLTAAQTLEIARLYAEGYTQKALAAKYRCTDVTIGNALRRSPAAALLGRNGAAASVRRALVTAKVRALRSAGRTQKDVAAELGISQAFVSKLERENE